MADPVLHVRYDGRSQDIPLGELDLGPNSADEEVRGRAAIRLGVDASKLLDYVIDRHETGNLTLRPEAVFG